jgi:UDP-glucose 4-epimerase
LLGGEVVYIPKRPGEPDCTFADITRIKSLLKWNPKISFNEGVQLMLNNIEYWREAPLWDPGSIETATRDWFKYLGK